MQTAIIKSKEEDRNEIYTGISELRSKNIKNNDLLMSPRRRNGKIIVIDLDDSDYDNFNGSINKSSSAKALQINTKSIQKDNHINNNNNNNNQETVQENLSIKSDSYLNDIITINDDDYIFSNVPKQTLITKRYPSRNIFSKINSPLKDNPFHNQIKTKKHILKEKRIIYNSKLKSLNSSDNKNNKNNVMEDVKTTTIITPPLPSKPLMNLPSKKIDTTYDSSIIESESQLTSETITSSSKSEINSASKFINSKSQSKLSSKITTTFNENKLLVEISNKLSDSTSKLIVENNSNKWDVHQSKSFLEYEISNFSDDKSLENPIINYEILKTPTKFEIPLIPVSKNCKIISNDGILNTSIEKSNFNLFFKKKSDDPIIDEMSSSEHKNHHSNNNSKILNSIQIQEDSSPNKFCNHDSVNFSNIIKEKNSKRSKFKKISLNITNAISLGFNKYKFMAKGKKLIIFYYNNKKYIVNNENHEIFIIDDTKFNMNQTKNSFKEILSSIDQLIEKLKNKNIPYEKNKNKNRFPLKTPTIMLHKLETIPEESYIENTKTLNIQISNEIKAVNKDQVIKNLDNNSSKFLNKNDDLQNSETNNDCSTPKKKDRKRKELENSETVSAKQDDNKNSIKNDTDNPLKKKKKSKHDINIMEIDNDNNNISVKGCKKRGRKKGTRNKKKYTIEKINIKSNKNRKTNNRKIKFINDRNSIDGDHDQTILRPLSVKKEITDSSPINSNKKCEIIVIDLIDDDNDDENTNENGKETAMLNHINSNNVNITNQSKTNNSKTNKLHQNQKTTNISTDNKKIDNLSQIKENNERNNNKVINDDRKYKNDDINNDINNNKNIVNNVNENNKTKTNEREMVRINEDKNGNHIDSNLNKIKINLKEKSNDKIRIGKKNFIEVANKEEMEKKCNTLNKVENLSYQNKLEKNNNKYINKSIVDLKDKNYNNNNNNNNNNDH